MTNAFPQAKVERAVGTVFGIAAVGQAFGPLIGGGLTAVFNWRAVLLVNVPVSLVLIVLAYTSIHESRDETMPKDIDWFGLGLIVTSISAFTYAVDRASDLGWTSASTLGLMVVGVIGVVVFIVVAVFAGLEFAMSWAFTSVSTQAVVPAQKAGQASGVVLTIVVTMGGVAIAIASTAAESAGAGVHSLENALRGVLIGAGVLAVAMSALLVGLGRRTVPTTAAAAAAQS